MHRVLLSIPGWLVTCDPHASASWVHHRDWLKYSGWLCVCMRVHMCTLEKCAYLCVHMRRLEVYAECLLPLLSTLSFEKGSLIELGAHGFQLDWLASELPGSPGLCLFHPVLELQMHVTSPSFYVGAKDPNSSTTSNFLKDLSTSQNYMFFLKGCLAFGVNPQ